MNAPLLAVTDSSGRAHYWTGESRFHYWLSLCGLESSWSGLHSSFKGYKVCVRCSHLKTTKGSEL